MRFRIKSKKNKTPQLSIFPITKSIRYNSRLNPEVIKKQIVDKMWSEILLSTNFTIEDQGDGTTIMVGRLDTVKLVGDEDDK